MESPSGKKVLEEKLFLRKTLFLRALPSPRRYPHLKAKYLSMSTGSSFDRDADQCCTSYWEKGVLLNFIFDSAVQDGP